MAGLSPYWDWAGDRNGRIIPAYVDGLSDSAGDFAFCIGSDVQKLPFRRAFFDDAPSVYQAAIDLTAVDIIYFTWMLRTSALMPSPEILINAGAEGPIVLQSGTLLVKDTSVIPNLVDTARGIILPETAARLFTQADRERILRITGTGTAADTDFTLVAVPQAVPSQPSLGRESLIVEATATPSGDEHKEGQVGLLYRKDVDIASVAGTYAAATVILVGARWVARGYIDNTKVAEVYEEPGRAVLRENFGMHVSKLTGTHTVTFALELELYE